MNKTRIWTLRIFVLMTAMAMVSACDDSAPGLGGAGGEAGGMGGGGGEAGSAGEGGEGGMMGMRCISDSRCPDGQYCSIPDDENVGECVPGCREDGCTGEEICDLETRICVDGPCTADEECDEGHYCDEGECTPGCREPGEPCGDLDADGRSTVCDEESRECVPVYACCSAEDVCAVETTPGECAAGGGATLAGAADCSRNPCGIACTADEDCGDGLDRFCNPADDRCQDGCIPNAPGSCPPDQTCNPDTRLCEDLRCADDSDCPLSQYCDLVRGLCVDGCRDDAACPDGQRCIDSVCLNFCDPTEEGACGEGRYCDPDTNNCLDLCAEHAECEDDAFCDEFGHCVPGCRDDEGENGEPNNTWADAMQIELSPEENGVRFGQADGRVLCIGDPDTYRVDVGGVGSRIRVDVQFNQGTPSIRLQGAGPQGNCSVCEDEEGVERDSVDLGWACSEDNRCLSPAQPEDGQGRNVTLEYPPLNSILPFETSYFVEVEPSNGRVDYTVNVTVVDAATGCFPDLREADGGDNNRRNSTLIESAGGQDAFVGTLCNDDQDWFRIALRPNDGLSVTLSSRDGTPIEGFIVPADANLGDADLVADAQGGQYLRQRGENAFRAADEWFIVVKAADPESTAGYDLEVRHIPSGALCGEDTEGEIDVPVGDAVSIGDALDAELAICTQDDPDVDLFCVGVGDGELLEAWVVTDAVELPGKFQAQFVDPGGVLTGRSARSTSGDDARDNARVAGTIMGNYCLRIEGVDGAQGNYDLFVQRTDLGADECALDLAEIRVRNDRAATATVMSDVNEDGLHHEFQDGYICDPQRVDEDWYRFTVPEPHSTMCVMLDGFDSAAYDIDLGLFNPDGNPNGRQCARQADCDEEDAGGGSCVDGRCTAATALSAKRYDFEMIHITRSELESLLDRDDNGDPEAGDFLLRVHHDDETEGPYQVAAILMPLSEECANDAYEGNNQRADASFLGAGQVGLCDAWICDSVPGTMERDEDWFEIEVPENEDRTIIVTRPDARGTIRLEVHAPDQPDAPGSGIVESSYGAGNHQCVNIRGGTAASVQLNVSGRPDRAGGNTSLPYSVRVVPTDLDENPIGACSLLGALDLDACPPWADWEFNEVLNIRLQPENCWPIVDIP